MDKFICVLYVTFKTSDQTIEQYRTLVNENGGHLELLNTMNKQSEWKISMSSENTRTEVDIIVSDVPFNEFSSVIPHLSTTSRVIYVSEEEVGLSGFPCPTLQLPSHDNALTHLKENLSNHLMEWAESRVDERVREKKETPTSNVATTEKTKGQVDEKTRASHEPPATGSEEEGTDDTLPPPAPKEKEEAGTLPPEDQQVNYQENPYQKRARKLQKQVFAKQRWEDHHTIGVWSPVPRMGVTSLTMNFAFYLAKRSVYTAVLEGLTERHALKDWLKRYTEMPAHWNSLAHAIQNDSDIENTNWNYKNVTFLPLDRKDPNATWNHDSLESYITTTRVMDVTLVDLPTGKMENHTRDSLQFLDQLWILVDDAFQEIVSWKEYIRELQESAGISVYLVFNKSYSFSQTERMQKTLGYPLLATIPAFHEEMMRNYYESTPLYFQEDIQAILDPPFDMLAQHLFKEPLPGVVLQTVQKPSWMRKILKPLLT